MDPILGLTLIGFILCMIFIDYGVYRIRESERIRARLVEVRRYNPVLEPACKR